LGDQTEKNEMGRECSMYRARIFAYIVSVGIRGLLKEVA
jgi:hypothetical protein